LFSHYVRLGKVRDVQLMECAGRYGVRERIVSLRQCVRQYGDRFWSRQELRNWMRGKDEGKLFFTLNGYQVLEDNPLPTQVAMYIAGDVACLFKLHVVLEKRMKTAAEVLKMPEQELFSLVDRESIERLRESCSANYNPTGPDKSMAPIAFQQMEVVDIFRGASTDDRDSWLELLPL